MRTVLSWLCDFADFESLVDKNDPAYLDNLTQLLTDAMNERGFVVEAVEQSGFELTDVVVAKVLEVESIIGADRIRRVLVDAGVGEPTEVVCGAFNFGVGDYVPLAKVGAVLPGNFVITARKMKGIPSNGMLCSARELALGIDSDGLLVLDGLFEPGMPIMQALGIAPDVVFDLAIEANRPDANCHMGVARELAVHFGLGFSVPEVADLSGVERITLDDAHLGTVGTNLLLLAKFDDVRGLIIQDYIGKRLTLAGMRSLSPVVDVSNYVMLELGQPTHPYDMVRLGCDDIKARPAMPSEKVQTLDGQTRILGGTRNSSNPSVDLVIVDAKDSVIGIAGIMGGAASEISQDTSSVLLEVANFAQDLVAKTSKKLGLRSEASARFERGVDPDVAEVALARFAYLLSVKPSLISMAAKMVDQVEILLRPDRVEKILGQALPLAELLEALEKMGFVIRNKSQQELCIVVPSNRPDITLEIDLIEEVARHYGYHRIERHELTAKRVGKLTKRQILRRQLIDFAIARGYYEAWSPTLLAPGEQERLGDKGEQISVSNPMALEESILRRSLLAGLLRSVGANLRRRTNHISLFEVGSVFSPPTPGETFPRETERAGFISYLPSADKAVAFEVFSALIERFSLGSNISMSRLGEQNQNQLIEAGFFGMHPSRSVALYVGDEIVGALGEVDPFAAEEVVGDLRNGTIAYLELDLALGFYTHGVSERLAQVSGFPSAQFDLCFGVAKEQISYELKKTIELAISGYAGTVSLIDAYEGAALKDVSRSLTYRIAVASNDHTLVDAEIRAIRQGIIDEVQRRGTGQLRE